MSSDGSTWTYGYNKRRLLETEQLSLAGDNYAIGHTFNANGHESSLAYPDGSSVSYAPNALGEQTQVGTCAYNITRHPNGAVAGFLYGNGVTHTGTQTVRTLPDFSSDAIFGTILISDDYNWDANGNVTAILSGAAVGTTRQMQYDARDRLTFTSYDKLGPAYVNFSYDPLDNLRSYVTPHRDYTHEYDSNTWRLTRIRDPGNTTMYQYSYAGDAGNRGNVTTRFQAGSPVNLTHTFTVDQGNRVRALAGSAAQTYSYDGMGRRTIIRPFGDGSRGQIYSQAGQLVFEIPCLPSSRNCNARLPTTTSHLYLDRHAIARVQRNLNATTSTYIHTDGLGSPVAETDASGALVANSRSLHEPYGLLVTARATRATVRMRAIENRKCWTGLVIASSTSQRSRSPTSGNRRGCCRAVPARRE